MNCIFKIRGAKSSHFSKAQNHVKSQEKIYPSRTFDRSEDMSSHLKALCHDSPLYSFWGLGLTSSLFKRVSFSQTKPHSIFGSKSYYDIK